MIKLKKSQAGTVSSNSDFRRGQRHVRRKTARPAVLREEIAYKGMLTRNEGASLGVLEEKPTPYVQTLAQEAKAQLEGRFPALDFSELDEGLREGIKQLQQSPQVSKRFIDDNLERLSQGLKELGSENSKLWEGEIGSKLRPAAQGAVYVYDAVTDEVVYVIQQLRLFQANLESIPGESPPVRAIIGLFQSVWSTLTSPFAVFGDAWLVNILFAFVFSFLTFTLLLKAPKQ